MAGAISIFPPFEKSAKYVALQNEKATSNDEQDAPELQIYTSQFNLEGFLSLPITLL
jgi:hypothetical protein